MAISVSFQGERGAYSEAAARSFFVSSVGAGNDIETVPHTTFAKALKSTADNHTDHTILPVENSIEGSVGESYDLLTSTPLVVSGEIRHKIKHCLIGTGRIGDVRTARSHPQALGQCRRFLEEHEIKAMPAYDTAGSIKDIKEAGDVALAGIASRDAALLYGVPVIAEDIADNSSNYTRFLILSRDQKTVAATGQDKTSIIFSIKHEPGSLYKIIEKFYRNNVNMTKIESRPTKGNAWEYNFYVDFEGHVAEPKISQMIQEIRKDALVRVLGSYPSSSSSSSTSAITTDD